MRYNPAPIENERMNEDDAGGKSCLLLFLICFVLAVVGSEHKWRTLGITLVWAVAGAVLGAVAGSLLSTPEVAGRIAVDLFVLAGLLGSIIELRKVRRAQKAQAQRRNRAG